MDSVSDSWRLTGIRNGIHRSRSKNARWVATRDPVQPKPNKLLGVIIIKHSVISYNKAISYTMCTWIDGVTGYRILDLSVDIDC